MNAYSKDLRIRVLDAVDRGILRKEVAGLFGVSLSTIKRYVKRRRAGEDLEPRRSTGRKRRILATLEEKRTLWAQLQKNDEATLKRHCELWEEKRGVRVSIATMSRAIRNNKLGWTYKKRRWVPPNETKQREVLGEGALVGGRSSALRFRGRECSTSVRMVPLRARAPKGERAFGKAPKNWKTNVTLISCISLEGMRASR